MPEVDPARLRDEVLPRTLAELVERFPDDMHCAEVLRRWKYRDAFDCPRCCLDVAWSIEARKTDECRACDRRTSLTAWTVMHNSPKPLRLWYLAIYLGAHPTPAPPSLLSATDATTDAVRASL